jgi:hypothetical protein
MDLRDNSIGARFGNGSDERGDDVIASIPSAYLNTAGASL